MCVLPLFLLLTWLLWQLVWLVGTVVKLSGFTDSYYWSLVVLLCWFLYSASSLGMMSAGPTSFFTLGILLSLSSCIGPVSLLPCSVSLRDSISNGSFWHVIPMFSGGSRYVSTSPVWRFSSKFDVLKNSLAPDCWIVFFLPWSLVGAFSLLDRLL